MTMTFDDRVVLVTGGAKGLGRSFVADFAARGAKVVVCDVGTSIDGHGHDRSAVDDAVRELRDAGVEAVACAASIATPEGAQLAVESALDNFGRLDVLVHAAGVIRNAPADTLTLPDFDAVLDVHLRGGFLVSQQAFRAMRSAGYGRIVFLGSGVGAFGKAGRAAYASAKAGLLGLSRVLAHEGRDTDIASNVVLPVALTRMATGKEVFAANDLSDVLRPVQSRLGTEFVAPLVTWLADESCTVSGEIFSALAGRYARVFVGVTDGWISPGDVPPTAEEIGARLATIEDRTAYTLPDSMQHEMELVIEQLRSPGAMNG